MLITIGQAQKALSVAYPTIRRMIDRGLIQQKKAPVGKGIYIVTESVDAMFDKEIAEIESKRDAMKKIIEENKRSKAS